MGTIGNPIMDNLLYTLRRAHKKSKASLWKDVMERLMKPRSKRPSVNVAKIARLTKEGDKVVVPGKVLGDGEIAHKAIVGAYDYSSKASEKIRRAGGEALSLTEFVRRYGEGHEVHLII